MSELLTQAVQTLRLWLGLDFVVEVGEGGRQNLGDEITSPCHPGDGKLACPLRGHCVCQLWCQARLHVFALPPGSQETDVYWFVPFTL